MRQSQLIMIKYIKIDYKDIAGKSSPGNFDLFNYF